MSEKTETELREDLARAGRILFERGLTNGAAGNMSVALPDGNFIVTPTGCSLGHLNIDELSKVDANGTLLSGKKPTKEVPFHIALYKVNPSVKAIIHLHSSYSTAYACLDGLDPMKAIKPMTPYLVMRLGKVIMTPYRKPGSTLIADDISKVGAGNKAFLLANHGMVVGGKDMNDALNNAQELEESCKLYFLTKGSNIRYLTDADIKELL